jgi:hypothetical protein
MKLKYIRISTIHKDLPHIGNLSTHIGNLSTHIGSHIKKRIGKHLFFYVMNQLLHPIDDQSWDLLNNNIYNEIKK